MSVYEPLKTREIEVLSLMSEGLTNREIAERLYIGVETVRTYAKQIYSKLGVSGRDEASQKARELGLINQTSTIRHNLPVQATPFVGREVELKKLSALLLAPDTRLLTILAPGGMGKTRLALQLAEHMVKTEQQFAHGVYFVELASISDSRNLVDIIAQSTGYQFQADGRQPETQLIDYFREKTLLLLLDNFEHILDGAQLVTDILSSTERVTILSTSRERLNLQGETIYILDGMIDNQNVQHSDVVQLFIQSAKQADPNFQLQDSDLPYLADICQLTGGMPLAIVLAAAWVNILTLKEIATEIQQSLDILETEMRDIPRRQWNIRAVFEPTWKRLSQTEQDVFMRLSVFRGGFTRDAAESIASLTLRMLQSFSNKGLLLRRADGRFELHELLRQYAGEHLLTSGQLEATRDAHCHYYLSVLGSHDEYIWTNQQSYFVETIEVETENMRQAWIWAYTHQKFTLLRHAMEGLYWLFWHTTRYQEGKNIFQKTASAIHMDEPSGEQGIVFGHTLSFFAAFEIFGGNWAEGAPILTRSVKILRDLDAQWEALNPGLVYMIMLGVLTEYDEAQAACLEIIHFFEERNETWGVAVGYTLLGTLNSKSDKHEEGLQQLNHALELFRSVDSLMGIVWTTGRLASVALYAEDYPTAFALYKENSEGWLSLGIKSNYANNVLRLGLIAQAQGLHKQAVDYLERGKVILGELGLRNNQARSYWEQGILYYKQGRYPEAQQILEQSEALSRENDYIGLLTDILCILGQTNLAMSQNEQALDYYSEALQLTKSFDAPMYTCLAVIAGLAMFEDDAVHAVEWLSMSVNHPQSKSEVKRFAETGLSTLKARLSEEQFASALERGKSLDYKQIIQELIDNQ